MTAVDENAPQRKRIATYGKAIRKRLPEYAGHEEQPESSDGARRLHKDAANTHTVYSLPRVPRSQRSSPARSTTSAGSNVFDFPSSDEAEDATPKKRRKILKADVQLKRSSPKTPKISRRTPDSPRFSASVYDASMASSNRSPQADQRTKPSEKSREASRAPADIEEHGLYRPDPIFAVHRSSPPKPTRKDNASRTNQSIRQAERETRVKAVHPEDTSPATEEIIHEKLLKADDSRKIAYPVQPRSMSTPPPVPFEGVNMKELPESQRASPSVLTPKGLRMWDGLLGDDADESLVQLPLNHKASETSPRRTINGKPAISRYGQQPRRRLIDSLVEQSKDPERTLGNFSDSSDDAGSLNEIESDLPQEASTSTKLAESFSDVNTKSLNPSAVSSTLTTGPKFTYSRQRSMLAEPDFVESIDIELSEHPSLSQSSNRSQNRRGIQRNTVSLFESQLNEEVEDGSGGAIRSVHELRQAGATKRYLDEMEDLLDRIGGSTQKPSLRRFGLLELAEKMHDKEFFQNFINNAMDQRLFINLKSENDTIAGFLIVSLVLIILDVGMTPVGLTHLRDQGFTQLLAHLIDFQDGIIFTAKDRKSNMSKAAQQTLVEEQYRLLELGSWDPPKPTVLSPRTVALACLELLVRQAHDAGSQDDFMSKDLMKRLFKVLQPLSYKDPHHELSIADLTNLRLSLAILESQSLNLVEIDSVWYDEYFPIIRDLLKNIVAATFDDHSSLQNLVLRLTLNITNNNSNASDIFATPELMDRMSLAIVQKLNMLSHFLVEAERMVVVDQLVLMLGVMINFAEWSSHARQCFVMLTEANQNPLADMVHIFSDNLEKTSEADSMESIHLNVAFGYLSVLLGTLCLSNDIANRVRLLLPNRSLLPLITSIEEFISHHKKVDSLLEDEDDSHESQTHLTQRLSRVVEALREKTIV